MLEMTISVFASTKLFEIQNIVLLCLQDPQQDKHAEFLMTKELH